MSLKPQTKLAGRSSKSLYRNPARQRETGRSMQATGNFALRLPAPSQFMRSVADKLRHHPKRVTAGLAILLLGTGVTAFGVAPLVPDAADLPVRQVLESVEPLATQAQTESLADFRFNLFRTETTRSTDTADALL